MPEGSDPNDGGGTGGGERTFTQADLDRIVADRLARVKPAFVDKVVAPDDYEALRAQAAELAELKKGQQSESERLTAALEAEKAGRVEATTNLAQLQDALNRERIAREVTRVAAVMKAIDPSDVVALLAKDAVTIGDDGQVKGAEEAVKALLEAKPHLVGGSLRPRPDPGQGAGNVKSSGVSAGRERGRAERAEVEAQRRNPFEGMTLVGGVSP